MVLALRPPFNVQTQAHRQNCLLTQLPQHLGTRQRFPAYHTSTERSWQTRGQCSLRTLQAVGTAQDQQLQAVEVKEDLVAQEQQPPPSTTSSASSSGAVPYSVVNFYHLTDVEHPFRVSFQLLSLAEVPVKLMHRTCPTRGGAAITCMLHPYAAPPPSLRSWLCSLSYALQLTLLPSSRRRSSRAAAVDPGARDDGFVLRERVIKGVPLVPRMQALREHQGWMLGREIAGRIYISAQGINAQYSGPTEDALAYARWVAAQPGFEVRLCGADACCGARPGRWSCA